MSEQDDIRRGLEELSSRPPARDRKPAVHAAIAVVRRRHQIGGGIAISVVMLLAAVAFASLPTRGRTPAAALETPIQTPTIAPKPTAAATQTQASSAATAGGPVKPPTALVNAAPAPETSPGVRSVAPASTAATRVTPASKPITSTVTVTVTPPVAVSSTQSLATKSPASSLPPVATSQGAPPPSIATEALTADVQSAGAADGSAAPETTVTVRVRGNIYGSIDGVTLWYTTIHRVGDAETQTRTCAVQSGGLHPVDETFTFRTRYRAAGTQQIDATVNTIGSNCVRDATERQWPFSAKVMIPVGSSLSNGVQPVTLNVGTPAVLSSRITLDASASDPDGYVSGFTINWGTGIPDQYPGGNGANCSSSEYGGVFWPAVPGSGTFTSPVLAAGTYSVTVTATTTGCDGKDAQTAQQITTVTVP